jgi:hypothetical protein
MKNLGLVNILLEDFESVSIGNDLVYILHTHTCTHTHTHNTHTHTHTHTHTQPCGFYQEG